MAEEGIGSACLDTIAVLYVSIPVQQEPGGPACLVDHLSPSKSCKLAVHMSNRA